MKRDENYELIDSGEGRKLERFGAYVLARPCSQAIWRRRSSHKVWDEADATFDREEGNRWQWCRTPPESWQVEVDGLRFKIVPTDFGHLGIFPEQRPFWRWVGEALRGQPHAHVLNLFAYSGGATLAAARAGARVCHLDASKGMVDWARENARLNRLEGAPIRWIVDDVGKFLEREIRREQRYDAIIMDPPSFGRGTKGELFKIEAHLVPLLERCQTLLSDRPRLFLLSCHTPGITPLVLHNLLLPFVEHLVERLGGTFDTGEMVLDGPIAIPSGAYARWRA